MEIRDYEHVLIPNILADFKCSSSGECCQSKWRIDINEEAYKRTQEKLSQQKEDIETYVELNENNDYVTQFSDGYCKFITSDKLCKIHKEFGWQCLSDTCKVYPRVLKLTSRGIELSLMFSCKSSARLLLSKKKFEILKLDKKDYFFMSPNNIGFIIPENNLETNLNSRYYEIEKLFIDIMNRDENIGKKISYLRDFIGKNLYTNNAAAIDFDHWEKDFANYAGEKFDLEGEEAFIETLIAKEERNKGIPNEYYSLLKINKLAYDLEADRDFLREEKATLTKEGMLKLKELWNDRYENILNNYILCLVFYKDMYYNLDFGFLKIVLLAAVLKMKILLNKSYVNRELTDDELIYIIKSHDNDFSHDGEFFNNFYTEKGTRESIDNYVLDMSMILY